MNLIKFWENNSPVWLFHTSKSITDNQQLLQFATSNGNNKITHDWQLKNKHKLPQRYTNLHTQDQIHHIRRIKCPEQQKPIILTSNNASSTDDKSQSLKHCAKSNAGEGRQKPNSCFRILCKKLKTRRVIRSNCDVWNPNFSGKFGIFYGCGEEDRKCAVDSTHLGVAEGTHKREASNARWRCLLSPRLVTVYFYSLFLIMFRENYVIKPSV